MEEVKGSVLIVDDDQSFIELLSFVLAKEGYRVQSANTGEGALEIVKKSPPNAVLLDIKLPMMSGMDTLTEIKEINSKVAVIMITGYGYEDEMVNEATKRGADGYIGKNVPLSMMASTFKWMSEAAIKGTAGKLGGRILVVEDEKDICDMIGFYLRQKGYDVLIANTGEAALEAVASEQPDLILLDIIMPDINGMELLKRIRVMDKKVKIIMMTGVQEEATKSQAALLGAKDYLAKPFNLETLLGKIVEHLGNLNR